MARGKRTLGEDSRAREEVERCAKEEEKWRWC
jgi:hypothetical protein